MALLLHLSDLHLRDVERAETTLGQLIDDLSDEIDIDRLDFVVISGDSTDFASAAEYGAAESFVKGLCDEYAVAPEQLLIVPGNHDVDWSVSKDLYDVVRTDAAPHLTAAQYQDPENKRYVEVVTDVEAYKRRFANFAAYHEAVTGREYPLDYARQFQVLTTADRSVVVLGLNTAWNLDHFHKKDSSIPQRALNNGLREVRRAAGEAAFRVVVWHHPLKGDAALPDPAFLQRLAVNGFVVGLHGHVHKPEFDQFHYEHSAEGRRIHLVGAGTLDAPDVTRGYPYQYNILEISDGAITVRSRGREDRDGAWHAYARFGLGKGKPPTDRLTLELPGGGHRAPTLIEATSVPPRDHVDPIKTLADVIQHLRERRLDATGYRIAVEALIFDANGLLLLQERGHNARDEVGKLEGVGGTVFGDDLLECVEHHVREEIGASVRIEVDELLEGPPNPLRRARRTRGLGRGLLPLPPRGG